MGFSIRDGQTGSNPLCNQRGQGIVEYILILIVTVAIILGALYRLNSAFREYAMNYFGDYLACLLETGELPTIGGNPGDSGICNTIFKPFTLEDGRPLSPGYAGPGQGTSGGKTGGSSERNGGGSRASSSRVSGGGGSSFGGGRFSAGRGRGSTLKGTRMKGGKSDSTYTGSTSPENYGGGYGATNRKISTKVKSQLDNKFAFEDEREPKQKRSVAGTSAKPKEEAGGNSGRSRAKRNEGPKNMGGEGGDSGMDLPNFMRYLIIAGILIALFMFLGGQMLQIGKSME